MFFVSEDLIKLVNLLLRSVLAVGPRQLVASIRRAKLLPLLPSYFPVCLPAISFYKTCTFTVPKSISFLAAY